MVVFEAPKKLTEKAKHMADERMISTSALCRQALMQYITKLDMYDNAELSLKN